MELQSQFFYEPNVSTSSMSGKFESETVLTDKMTGDEAMPVIQNHFVPLFEYLFDENVYMVV